MTTATADRTASHYLVREYYDGTPVTVESYVVDTMTDALELAGMCDPAEGVIGLAFVVFTDGTEEELR